jgi:hypothetical protein
MRTTMRISLAACASVLALGLAAIHSANAADMPLQPGAEMPPPQPYGPPVQEGYAYPPPPAVYAYPPPVAYDTYAAPVVVAPGPYYGPYWGGYYGPRFAYGYGHWGRGWHR